MTRYEWNRVGTQKFGASRMAWSFTCPGCGGTQTPQDFVPFMPQGARPEMAYTQCLSTFTGDPCGYRLQPNDPTLPAVEDNGTAQRVFPFAP